MNSTCGKKGIVLISFLCLLAIDFVVEMRKEKDKVFPV